MSDNQPNNENTVPSSQMESAQLRDEHYARLQKHQTRRRQYILVAVLVGAVLAALYFFLVA